MRTANWPGFNEKKPGAGVINAGVYLFRTPTIGQFPDKTPLSFETDVFPALITEPGPVESLRDGRAVFGYRHTRIIAAGGRIHPAERGRFFES